MTDEITLTVDGLIFGGWKEFRFRRALDECTSAFSLSLSERWAGSDVRRAVTKGSAYQLAVGGEVIAAGGIDDVAISYDTELHDVVVTGRDWLADIVDCAASPNGPYEFRNLRLDEIAQRLLQPYGLAVTTQCDVGAPFARFAIQPGETVWTAIERAMRFRAVLAHSDASRTLIFTRAGLGGDGGAIALGRNAKNATGFFSMQGCFSEIILRSQAEASDGLDVASEMQASAAAHDELVPRYRPTVIVGENAAQGQSLKERADWHKAVARGRATSASYTLAGWRNDAGKLWQPNTLVQVEDDYLNVRETLVATAVELVLTVEGGKEATVDVAPPSAYSVIAEAEETEADAAGSGGGGTAYDWSKVWP